MSDDQSPSPTTRAQIAEFIRQRERGSIPPPEDPTRARWFSARDLASVLYAAITAAVIVAGTWYTQAAQTTVIAERQEVVRATLTEHRQRMEAMDRDRAAMKEATAANQQLMIAATTATAEQLKALNLRLARIESQLDRR